VRVDRLQRLDMYITTLSTLMHKGSNDHEMQVATLHTYRPGGERRPDAERLVNLSDYNGWTPLHYACFDENKELLQQLLEAGADPTAR